MASSFSITFVLETFLTGSLYSSSPIDDLIDKQHSVLNNESIQKKVDKYLNEDDKDRLECFNDKYQNDERDLLSKLYKDSEMVIINNS